MTRAEVRAFIEAGADSLNIPFESGRVTEFNSARSNIYPFIYLISISTDTDIINNSLPYDNWNIEIHISKLDKADSSNGQYESLIDDCDVIAQKLALKYNQVVTGYKLVTIQSINRTPFIKKHADCLTGVILSFTLNSPDTTSYCE